MSKLASLHVGTADIPCVRVAHILCMFPNGRWQRRRISSSFGTIREWLVGFGLDPDTLLHIGIPMLDGETLVAYDCCIEFPLPIDEEGDEIHLKSLPGGRYAVLRVEKVPAKISRAIRQFRGDYIPEHDMLLDASRPIYEIYYKDTMEYCVPLIVPGKAREL